MKTVVAKRQYGSIKWYEFESFDEMMQDEVLSYLAYGDGYDGILDIYTDDKDILSNEFIYDKYDSYLEGIEVYPLSELPEDKVESPVDSVLLSYASRKPWNLE